LEEIQSAKKPFPFANNKSNNADLIQAIKQPFWTYNNKTGKCEEFKGEGYYCQDDDDPHNLYHTEKLCRHFCMQEDTKWKAYECYFKVKLPIEPCQPVERWTNTKDGCTKYEIMGQRFVGIDFSEEKNHFYHSGACDVQCPKCDNPPDLIIPCQMEEDLGRNPNCEKEPFPYAYNKSNNADLVQAKRQPFWTYNKMTGKCELFKGEGYYCQDGYTGYNLYDDEQSCRVNCMLKDTSKATAIEMVKWRRHLRPEECYHKVILPKEPCKPVERWTLTKDGCKMYAAMGGKLARENQEINQFGYSDDCKYSCPKCAQNTSPSPTAATSTITPTEARHTSTPGPTEGPDGARHTSTPGPTEGPDGEYGPGNPPDYCAPGHIENPEPGKDDCIPVCKPNYKIYEEGSDSCCESDDSSSACCHTIGDWSVSCP